MDGKNFIYSQKSEEVRDKIYGKKRVSYNGCGPVCLYNLLVMLSRNVSFDTALQVLEEHLAFGGILGTFSGSMKKALHRFGCDFECARSRNGTAELLKKGSIFAVHLNNGFMFFRGRHWVAFEKKQDGRIYALNAAKKDRISEYSSFDEFYERYIKVGSGSIHRLFMIK